MKKRWQKSVSLILTVASFLSVGSLFSLTANASNTTNEGSTTALKSDIQNMHLEGYVGENLIGNVKNWQIEAYHNNRGIIEQIAIASSGKVGLDKILGTDYFGVDQYYTIDISEMEGDHALKWTLKHRPGSFADRDFRFENDPNATTDWQGAKALLVHINASELTENSQVRIAFEENAVGRESYQLKENATVYLKDQAVTVLAGGYVPIPKGFVGNIRLPLNTDTFARYWGEADNHHMDLSKVVQFQLSVKGQVGKSLYMDDFSIIKEADDSTQTVWTLEGLAPRTGYTGAMVIWYGEFVGKLLTGMAYCYKATADEALLSAANEIIAELEKAQGEDGYLGVFLGGARYSLSADNWDLWNQYHCITGLLEWYKLTQNEVALTVATKTLDCIYRTFQNRSYIVAGGFETNRGIAHGYAQMYQITGDKKYLNEAERIIQEDCQDANGWYKCALRGKEFATSSCTRWEVLHMVMTLGILYEETHNQEYYDIMGAVWESVLRTDVHNSGSFTTNEGACGNPFAEGIVETCCTIAWSALTNEYLKYNKTVRVADELERSYFNGLLGSLLDDDKYCTYNTPQDGIEGSCDLHGGVYDGRRVPSQQDISFQFNTGSPDMNCCQANIARGIGQIAEWAVMGSGNELYLNYYGTSSIETLVNGKPITLTQTTQYPLNGAIRLIVSGLEEETEFTLKLRIPTWAYGSKVSYDDHTMMAENGKYFAITKTWKNGDTVTLDLAISFTYWAGEREQTGYTSVFYGPILLTLDDYYAPNCDQNTLFERDAIESAVIRSGGKNGAWLCAEVKQKDQTVRLVSFADAGKYNDQKKTSTYWSWLKVADAPKVKKGVTWQNTDKHKIQFGENIEWETALAYAGQTVTFTVKVPNGKAIDAVTVSDADVRGDNGVYSFIMPDSDTTVAVHFTAARSDGGSAPKNNKKSLVLPLVAIGEILLTVAAVVWILIKKKKKQRT